MLCTCKINQYHSYLLIYYVYIFARKAKNYIDQSGLFKYILFVCFKYQYIFLSLDQFDDFKLKVNWKNNVEHVNRIWIPPHHHILKGLGLWCLTLLSIIFQLYRSGLLLVEETGVPGENHRSFASHWQTLSHNLHQVHLAMSGIQINTLNGDRHWLHM